MSPPKEDKTTIEERLQAAAYQFLSEVKSLAKKNGDGEVELKVRIFNGGINWVRVTTNKESRH